jgi:hypothetical protein
MLRTDFEVKGELNDLVRDRRKKQLDTISQ